MHVIDVLFVSIISHGFELMVTVVSKWFRLNPEPLIFNVEFPFIKPVKLLDSLLIVKTLLISGHVAKSHLFTA